MTRSRPIAIAFVVVAGGVGFKLVQLWRKTRQVPEMTLGFGLAVVALGMPLAALGRVPDLAMQPLGRVAFALGLTINVTGICLLSELMTYPQNSFVAPNAYSIAQAMFSDEAAIKCCQKLARLSIINWNIAPAVRTTRFRRFF